MVRTQRAAQAAMFLLVAISVAACGGGGGGSSSGGGVPVLVPTAAPPNSASTSVSAGPQAVSTALPAVGGYSGTLQLPPANVSATVTVNTSTTVPSGLAAPQVRHAMSSPNIPLFYLALTAQASITVTGTPQLVVTMPSGTDMTKNFYLAAYLGNAWVTFDGPGAVSGNTVTFTTQNGSVVLSGGVTLQLVLYSGAPLQSGLSVSPSAVQLLSATDSQTVTVTDVALPATFSLDNTLSIVNSTCHSVATVSQASATTFTVDAIAVGTCSFSIADSFGSVAPVSVSVTTTSVVAQ